MGNEFEVSSKESKNKLDQMVNERNELIEINEKNSVIIDKMQGEFNELKKLLDEQKNVHELDKRDLLREKNAEITALERDLEKTVNERRTLDDINEHHLLAINIMEEKLKERENHFTNLLQKKTDESMVLQ